MNISATIVSVFFVVLLFGVRAHYGGTDHGFANGPDPRFLIVVVFSLE